MEKIAKLVRRRVRRRRFRKWLICSPQLGASVFVMSAFDRRVDSGGLSRAQKILAP